MRSDQSISSIALSKPGINSYSSLSTGVSSESGNSSAEGKYLGRL
ncbi:MAG: hypothetical protein RMY34_17460 [Aulosira sp. DedQUE10]|nr:hypothetical protein [Aulosira sp. DedQUE10]